jgi:hypothetical protein
MGKRKPETGMFILSGENVYILTLHYCDGNSRFFGSSSIDDLIYLLNAQVLERVAGYKLCRLNTETGFRTELVSE